jgi:hypothetical protein
MQQTMYADNPQDVLTYFDYLQVVNTSRWTGWTPYYDANGPVFYNGMIQSYINVGPKTSATADGSSSNAGVITAVVVAAVAVAGVLAWLLLRRRRGPEDEEV